MIEPGKYMGALQMVGVSESRTCTPYVYGEYSIMADGESVTRTVYFYLSDAAWKSTREKLESVGFNGDFSEPAFEQQETELKCKHEEYKGKVGEKWELASWGGGGKEDAPDAVIAQLNARWKSDQPVTDSKAAAVKAHMNVQTDDSAAPF